MKKNKTYYINLAQKIVDDLISSKILVFNFNSNSENYIDRFKYITKEKFEEIAKTEINKFNDETTDVEFEASMRKIFASLKDAHTVFGGSYPKKDRFDCKFLFINNEVYAFTNTSYLKVTKINGVPINEIVNKLGELISYEVTPWKMVATERFLLSPRAYQLIKVENKDINKILVEGINDKQVLTKLEVGLHEMNYDNKANSFKPYEFKSLQNDVIYINYRACRSLENYPFKTFVEDIKNSIGDRKLKGVILDVRENTGGSTETIIPLINFLKKYELNSTNTVVLGSQKTFSSGIFAVRDFKINFNATLIGEPLGQPTETFGQKLSKEIEDFTYSMTEKLFDISDAFKNKGIINPDIVVNKTLDDYLYKKDKQLEVATNYIQEQILDNNPTNTH